MKKNNNDRSSSDIVISVKDLVLVDKQPRQKHSRGQLLFEGPFGIIDVSEVITYNYWSIFNDLIHHREDQRIDQGRVRKYD